MKHDEYGRYGFQSEADKIREEIPFEKYLDKYCNQVLDELDGDDLKFFKGAYENFIGVELQKRKKAREFVKIRDKMFRIVRNNAEITINELSQKEKDYIKWDDMFISQYGEMVLHGTDEQGNDTYKKIDDSEYDIEFYNNRIKIVPESK